MLKDHVSKLYELLSKIMILLECEIDLLESCDDKSSINIKKSITDSLNKLVYLLVQLNKLSKAEKLDYNESASSNDQEIIDHFVEQYISNVNR